MQETHLGLMTRVGAGRIRYADKFGGRPFSRFTDNASEIRANALWCERADKWAESEGVR